MPEYNETRKKAGGFLNLCYTPELAAEVTLQPIRRFGMDAAIIFSDILVIPHALGINVEYHEGKGPLLTTTRNLSEINKLNTKNISEKLSPVGEAIKIVARELPKQTALIGFAGAPWTVATYMIEGGSSKNFEEAKKLAYTEPKTFKRMLGIIIDATSEYLSMQINSGAEVIQIFDSWAGVLTEDEFKKWVIKPTSEIVKTIKEKHPQVKIIGFPKGAGLLYKQYIKNTRIDAVGMDINLPLKWAKQNLQKKIPVQGNLDPVLLASDKEAACRQAERIINNFSGGPHIFNLGHGILPHTPVDNVKALIDTVRKFNARA